ncbi:hypothetical protein J6590_074014, partial [Homalodisca vitripennis]
MCGLLTVPQGDPVIANNSRHFALWRALITTDVWTFDRASRRPSYSKQFSPLRSLESTHNNCKRADTESRMCGLLTVPQGDPVIANNSCHFALWRALITT